ncbi:MAG: undecaprenyl-diphosphate phosphatase [Syntrophobacterales bacterium]|nr:undecaprenyl-diphosphate phosphatase [Syntrophobacterales bacterium]
MDIFSAFILGILQGVTEFLPISSSGHLVVAQWLLGFKEPEVFFDVVLHMGTFLAVIIVFRRDLSTLFFEALEILRILIKKSYTTKGYTLFRFIAETMIGKVIVGTIPAVVVGFFFKDQIETLFASPFIVGINFFITGALLILTRWAPIYPKGYFNEPTYLHALIIGIAQAIAIAPGISRSGSTISTALITGCSQRASGTFSFLLFVPAVLGAITLEIPNIGSSNNIPPTALIVGFLTSFIVGYTSLKLLLRTVLKGSFYRFGFYCFVVGIVTLLIVSIR